MSLYRPKGEKESALYAPKASTTTSSAENAGTSWGTSTNNKQTRKLEELLNNQDLCQYLFSNHTFIHGKKGFYEKIINETNNRSTPNKIKTWYKPSQLPKSGRISQRVILSPIVKSEIELNTFVANALLKSNSTWLIAPPESIQRHLLLAFKNFFISSGTKEELSPLLETLKLPVDIASELSNPTSLSYLFVTNFELFLGNSISMVWIDLSTNKSP